MSERLIARRSVGAADSEVSPSGHRYVACEPSIVERCLDALVTQRRLHRDVSRRGRIREKARERESEQLLYIFS